MYAAQDEGQRGNAERTFVEHHRRALPRQLDDPLELLAVDDLASRVVRVGGEECRDALLADELLEVVDAQVVAVLGAKRGRKGDEALEGREELVVAACRTASGSIQDAGCRIEVRRGRRTWCTPGSCGEEKDGVSRRFGSDKSRKLTERGRDARVRDKDVADNTCDSSKAGSTARDDAHVLVGVLALLLGAVRVVVVGGDLLAQLFDARRRRVLVDVVADGGRQVGERDLVGARGRAGDVGDLGSALTLLRRRASGRAPRAGVEEERKKAHEVGPLHRSSTASAQNSPNEENEGKGTHLVAPCGPAVGHRSLADIDDAG